MNEIGGVKCQGGASVARQIYQLIIDHSFDQPPVLFLKRLVSQINNNPSCLCDLMSSMAGSKRNIVYLIKSLGQRKFPVQPLLLHPEPLLLVRIKFSNAATSINDQYAHYPSQQREKGRKGLRREGFSSKSSRIKLSLIIRECRSLCIGNTI